MSFFSKILDKLGLGKKDEPASAGTTATGAPEKKSSAAAVAGVGAKAVRPAMDKGEKDNLAAPMKAAVTPVSEVDVVNKLEQLGKGSGLDWKVSIVDMLKVLGIDSGKDARIELAKELGCPAEFIGGDYSKMNVWLHKAVLKKIAENGGNIPANLLD
jgi:hypothetical protein